MARLPRAGPPGIPQHVIQRGNNRSPCFADDQDFVVYARWLNEYARANGVAVHAWVFMTNHVHLLVTPARNNGVSGLMQSLGRRYVRYFNHRHNRTGTLWEGRFKSCLVQTELYLLHCYKYIELNPVRARMVDNPADYPWSSYRCNAFGIESDLCTPHAEYLRLGSNGSHRWRAYRALFEEDLDEKLLQQIRMTLNKEMALGNDRFKDGIEALSGRRMRPAKRGRPKQKNGVR